MHDIKAGIYRHFKGKEYEVLGIAKHSETQENMVVYKALYGEHALWVRPKEMFFDVVDKPDIGYKGQRFTFLREK